MPERINQQAEQPSDHQDPEVRAIYARYRQEFTAADLQKYTEIEPGVPAEDVLAELEDIHRATLQGNRHGGNREQAAP